MNNAIINILNKELKNIFRDKFFIIILIVPIFIFPLINFGAEYIFNDSQIISNKSNIAIINNEDISIINKYFKNNDNYKITNSSNPFELLKNGDIDFIIMSNPNKTISFIYNSKYYSSLFKATSCGEKFEKELIKENKMKNPYALSCVLKDEKGNSTNSASIISLITPVVFILVVCQGNSLLANDIFAGEKERKTMELLLLSHTKKTTIYLGKVFTLLVIEILCTILNILSYTFSNYITPNNQNHTNINNFLSLIISAVSLCMITVFISSLISLLSKTYRCSQIINEVFSVIPVFAAIYFLIDNIDISDALISFIPIFNSVKSIINTMADEINIQFSLLSFTINFAYCILITLISNKYMRSEKILN